MVPPKETDTKNLWKLKKCAYGLSDARRHWHFKVVGELKALGAFQLKLDLAVFLRGMTITMSAVASWLPMWMTLSMGAQLTSSTVLSHNRDQHSRSVGRNLIGSNMSAYPSDRIPEASVSLLMRVASVWEKSATWGQTSIGLSVNKRLNSSATYLDIWTGLPHSPDLTSHMKTVSWATASVKRWFETLLRLIRLSGKPKPRNSPSITPLPSPSMTYV